MDELHARLETLEQQNRRLRRLWMVVLIPAGALLLLGAVRPAQKLQLESIPQMPVTSGALQTPLVAPRFIVQNRQGQVRGLLDSQGLFLFGPHHELRVWLTDNDLVYKGPDGNIRLAFDAKRGDSSLVLRDRAGNETDLGSINLATPAGTRHRNAASLVFQSRGRVVKQLP